MVDEQGDKMWFHRNVAKEIRPHSAARTKTSASRPRSTRSKSKRNSSTSKSSNSSTSKSKSNSPFKPPGKAGGSGGNGGRPPRPPRRQGHAVDSGKSKKKKTQKRSKPDDDAKEIDEPPRAAKRVRLPSKRVRVESSDSEPDVDMEIPDNESVEYTSDISSIPTIYTPFVVV